MRARFIRRILADLRMVLVFIGNLDDLAGLVVPQPGDEDRVATVCGVPARRAAGGGAEVRQLAPPVQTVLVQEPATVSCYTALDDDYHTLATVRYCLHLYLVFVCYLVFFPI